ncbi:MAG: bifunctional demethylmenaquinone methyltransferase/2-methoxy-6-polyprenyl-1,4-benzoquinol methylase UbiE [Bacteroidota bacterium]|nr:bifunctional demethylmenaquinone methyltransferase/2-methoxy-6-polyprenyl-1,4-benzoquinol methylase UbiE [Bacteroidota bacterium]
MNINKDKKQVSGMFDNIAGHYDFLNHFLSLSIDKKWRREAIDRLRDKHPQYILDVATGTADLAIKAAELKPESITGIDISIKMLSIGEEKIREKKLNNIIRLLEADCENLPFNDKSYDAVICAFGVRNFENLEKGLSEIYRVMKDDGKVVILEFSRPRRFPFKQLYNFYFKNILPLIGRIISKDVNAYKYLPETVYSFPVYNDFLKIMNKTGFIKTKFTALTFGVATIYEAEK